MKTNTEHQKELNWANLHNFLNTVRKADIELDIEVRPTGVVYRLKDANNFNNVAWTHTLETAKKQGDISEFEAEKFEKLMDGILHLL